MAVSLSSWPGLTRPSPQYGAATDGRVRPGHDVEKFGHDVEKFGHDVEKFGHDVEKFGHDGATIRRRTGSLLSKHRHAGIRDRQFQPARKPSARMIYTSTTT